MSATFSSAHLDGVDVSSYVTMTRYRDEVYSMRSDDAAVYDELYALYRVLRDAFGGVPADQSAASLDALAEVMPRLADIRDRVRGEDH